MKSFIPTPTSFFFLSLFTYSFFPPCLWLEFMRKILVNVDFPFQLLGMLIYQKGCLSIQFSLSDLVTLSAIVLNFSLFQIVIIKIVPIKWFLLVRWIMFYNIAKFSTRCEFPDQCQQNVGTFSPTAAETAEEGHLSTIWEETSIAFSQWLPILECQYGVLFSTQSLCSLWSRGLKMYWHQNVSK